MFAVGSGGTVAELKASGALTSLAVAVAGVTTDLMAVSGVPNDATIVGKGGTVLYRHYSGTWRLQKSPRPKSVDLLAVEADSLCSFYGGWGGSQSGMLLVHEQYLPPDVYEGTSPIQPAIPLRHA